MIFIATSAIAAAVLFLGLVVFVPSLMSAQQQVQQPQPSQSQQHAQLTLQEQQLSNCPASVINTTPPLIPGAFPVCPGSPLLPPNAHPPQLPLPPQALADTQKGHAILDELFKRISSDASPAHVAAVLKQMQSIYPGLVHCPSITNPGQCFVTSRPLGGPISPPIAP